MPPGKFPGTPGLVAGSGLAPATPASGTASTPAAIAPTTSFLSMVLSFLPRLMPPADAHHALAVPAPYSDAATNPDATASPSRLRPSLSFEISRPLPMVAPPGLRTADD